MAGLRILHVNKFLYRRGGAEAYMEDLAALQAAAGHEIAFFGMRHPLNPPMPYEAEFPSYVEFGEPGVPLGPRLRAAARMVHSSSAARGVARVADDFRPHLAHLHNVYHQLSPSILRPLAARGIPVVMTLHDYKLACPSYQFLDHGHVCEACLGGHFWHAPARRCKDGSLAASALLAAESYTHAATRAYARVSLFICPSRFLAGKMAEAGVFPERMRHVPHFVEAAGPAKEAPGGPLLYAGRLSPEKGVDVLLEALARLDPVPEVLVAGDGPARGALEARAAALPPGRVRFLGRVDKETVKDLMALSSAVVVPSRWHENQPMVVLEAFAAGVPVVATSLGGLPELVEDGVTGQVVPPVDPAALARALAALAADPARALGMGTRARRLAGEEFAPARHLDRVLAVYEEAGASKGAAA
ncbi:MAG: glycosyltransferase [Candidatus Dormibacterales bacterium]